MIHKQTIIIGVCFVIVLLIMLVNSLLPQKKQDTTLDRSKILITLAILLTFLPIALIKLYSVNCMLEGNCHVLVWVYVAIWVLLTAAYTGAFILKAIKTKKTQQEAIPF
jgi:hypothetical protein